MFSDILVGDECYFAGVYSNEEDYAMAMAKVLLKPAGEDFDGDVQNKRVGNVPHLRKLGLINLQIAFKMSWSMPFVSRCQPLEPIRKSFCASKGNRQIPWA